MTDDVGDRRFDHGHCLHGVDELVDRRLHRSLQGAEDFGQALAQAPLSPKIALNVREVTAHRLTEIGAASVEDRLDLGQREPQPPQRKEAIQPLNVGLAVQTVPARRPLRRDKQPDLVVMMQAAHRHTRRRGELTNPPTCRLLSGHRTQCRPSPDGRFKSRTGSGRGSLAGLAEHVPEARPVAEAPQLRSKRRAIGLIARRSGAADHRAAGAGSSCFDGVPPRDVIAEVQRELERRADAAKRTWWENYVKGAVFRGTPMGEVRKVVAAFVDDHRDLTELELKALGCELIAQPLTEDKLAGVLLFSEHLIDRLGLDDLPLLRDLLAGGHLGDWNSCDWFCVKVLGRMLTRASDPQPLADELIAWTASEELWVRRAGLVAFVNLAPRGDAALDGLTRRLIEGAARNVADQRRFAQTSVGWVLRELSKSEPDAVRAFLADHGEAMSSEARRAASARL
ncbi:MAG TPA: DNA alkylation repair protein [Solirubrobacteraceae bacterium]|nr:DNA alkylation repair protein [Solirubrobacteraceae bacterium]